MGGLDLCPEAGQRQGSRGKGQGVDAGARGSDQATLLRLTRCVFPQVKATLIWLMLSTTPVGARVSAGGAGGRRELLCVAWVGSGLRTPGPESSRCWRWTLTPHPTDAQVRAQSCVPGLLAPRQGSEHNPGGFYGHHLSWLLSPKSITWPVSQTSLHCLLQGFAETYFLMS